MKKTERADNSSKGFYKYNFLNAEDEARLFCKWGGEAFVRTKYPAVWDAVKRTREYEREVQAGRGSVQQVNGYVNAGCPNLVYAGAAGEKSADKHQRLSSLIQMRLEDGTYISENSSVNADEEPEPKTWPYAMLSGSIRNMTDSVILASYGSEFYNINSADAGLISDEIYNGTDFTKKCVETYSDFSAVDFNDMLHAAEYHIANPIYSDGGGNTFVRNIMVQAPYSSHYNNPIKMLYDREPAEEEKGLIDYSYKDVREDSQVKTCIPLAAHLQFAKDIVPATEDAQGNPIDILDTELSSAPQLWFGNPCKARVTYNRSMDEIKKCFIRNENELNIDFAKLAADHYWNTKMSVNNYTTGGYETGRTIELHGNFYINLMNLKYKTLIKAGISITSVPQDRLPEGAHYYQTEGGYNVYIPPVNIRWGCFASGTRIRMADGSTRCVENIRQGDMVYTTDGPLAVRSVYMGEEHSLMYICTEDGKELRLTHMHPVVLANGKTLPAKQVRPGHIVRSASGNSDRVKWVFECGCTGRVYNFELEDGKEHIVEAEGILTGEFVAQNSYKADASHQRIITPQTQALAEQLSALLRKNPS